MSVSDNLSFGIPTPIDWLKKTYMCLFCFQFHDGGKVNTEVVIVGESACVHVEWHIVSGVMLGEFP